MEVRQAFMWTVLLLAGQATDVLTTDFDRARGTLESMPITSGLLEQGGIALLWGTKLLLVAAVATALVVTARWAAPSRPGSRIVFRFALVCTQAVTIGLVCVSLTNALLLGSLIH
jgi:acyl dehydratase